MDAATQRAAQRRCTTKPTVFHRQAPACRLPRQSTVAWPAGPNCTFDCVGHGGGDGGGGVHADRATEVAGDDQPRRAALHHQVLHLAAQPRVARRQLSVWLHRTCVAPVRTVRGYSSHIHVSVSVCDRHDSLNASHYLDNL